MAYEFAASSSQYLTTSSAPTVSSTMTIACWANVTSTTTTQQFASIGFVGPLLYRYVIRIVATSNVQFLAVGEVGGVGTPGSATSAGTVTANTWIHGAGVAESYTSRKVYRNGVLDGTSTVDIGTFVAPTYMSVGASLGQQGQPVALLTGRIADVGIWDVALTAAEIASLAKGMACDKVRPQSLVFYAPLVRDLIDVKGGLTITNNNTATVANHPRVYQ